MAERAHSVDVVMATYNGVQHLDEQIESLANQSFRDFRLLIRDDGSSDGTAGLLRRHAARRPGMIQVLDDSGDHLGAGGSFGRLLEAARADYVMPCDQDDYWLGKKIAVSLQRLQQLEQTHGRQMPILVHTDMMVADAKLKPLHGSFWAYEGLDPRQGGTLRRLLLQNVAAGCTVMVNRALLQRALPIPQEALMHDWWLALVAAAFGRVGHLPKATMLYRQHGRNAVGAHELHAEYAFRRGLTVFQSGGIVDQLHKTQLQAACFLERFGAELSKDQRATVEAYATIRRRGFFRRRATLVRYGFCRHGWLRNVGLLASI